MDMMHSEVSAHKGNRIRVTLNMAANVRLMDYANFVSYRNGQPHRCYGGHTRTSPVDIVVPYSGNWHVVIDLGGGSGFLKASVNVLR